MSISDIIIMLIVGSIAAYVTAPEGVTTGDYIAYMCLWSMGWTFASLVVIPFFKRNK